MEVATGRQALIVEDDATFQRALRRLLERHGYVCTAVGDHAQVLDIAQAQVPEVVLLDLNLQGVFALDLIAPLRQRCPGAVIVVLTGCGQLEIAVSAIKAGADNFLVKPVDTATILAALQRAAPADAGLPDRRQYMELEDLELRHILRIVDEYAGNISLAAAAMGMHRRTLQRKMERLAPHLRKHAQPGRPARNLPPQ